MNACAWGQTVYAHKSRRWLVGAKVFSSLPQMFWKRSPNADSGTGVSRAIKVHTDEAPVPLFWASFRRWIDVSCVCVRGTRRSAPLGRDA